MRQPLILAANGLGTPARSSNVGDAGGYAAGTSDEGAVEGLGYGTDVSEEEEEMWSRALDALAEDETSGIGKSRTR
eukprot:SAG11_NODE_21347_length_427_cov_0.682927_1_plen_76_part_00